MDERLKSILEGLPFTLTDEQLEGIQLFIRTEGHFSFLGDSGSGKSTIMWVLKLYYGEDILFVASTGTASEELPNNIGSGTAHSLFNLARDQAIDSDWRKRPADILTKTDLIKIVVVDEGYCHNSQDLAMMLSVIKRVNKKNKNRSKRDIRLVLVGDCLQRLPIVSDKDYLQHLYETYGHYLMFESYVWKEARFTTWVLQDVKRQGGVEPKDLWFRKALRVMRYGMVEHYDHIIKGFNKKFVGSDHDQDAIYIAPTNSMVNRYNARYLARNPNQKITYKVNFDKDFDKKSFSMDWEVTLAEGCSFLTLVNNPEEGYFNGTVLTAKQVTSEGVWADKDDGTSVFVGLHEFKEEEVYAAQEDRYGETVTVQKRRHVASAWMLPVKLCAGFSFARCQGKTIQREVVLDFGTNSDLWLYNKQGMEDFMVAGAFVGFSRATSIDHIKLRNPLRKEHLKVCRTSINFWWKCVKELDKYKL